MATPAFLGHVPKQTAYHYRSEAPYTMYDGELSSYDRAPAWSTPTP